MAYQVDKFNGTFLTSVDDGTIDTTTDLRFVGKNYAGYGEVQNENFLHLLENFANTTAPPKPLAGQIWYDSGTKKLRFYDGTAFKIANGASASSVAPSGLAAGEFWFDTSSEQLYTWSGSEFVLIGPETPPEIGASGIVPQVVKDTLGVNHSISKLTAGGETVLIISKDEFTLDSILNPITGFTLIKKGITLVNTSAISGVTTTDHVYWGTASNALKLGNFSASDFIRSGSAVFGSGASFSDVGFTVGDQNDIKIYVENGDEPVIENQLGNAIKIKIRDAGISDEVAIFGASGMRPGITNTFNLGTTGNQWATVWATTVNAALTGNVTGNVDGNITGNLLATADSSVIVNADTKTVTGTFNGFLTGNVQGDLIGTANNALTLNGVSGSAAATATTVTLRDSSGNITANRFIGITDRADQLLVGEIYRSAAIAATGNTIAARDASGNLTAVVFNGTATAARYADLAEKYLPDAEYEAGTVVCVGGEQEITASSWGKRAIGVISTDPAYMMNSELEGGLYVALKGRVPVKVIGRIKKGEDLIAANNGCAMMAVPHASNVFAVALESSDDEGIKTIEALVL
jgi:hypothetical protein